MPTEYTLTPKKCSLGHQGCATLSIENPLLLPDTLRNILKLLPLNERFRIASTSKIFRNVILDITTRQELDEWFEEKYIAAKSSSIEDLPEQVQSSIISDRITNMFTLKKLKNAPKRILIFFFRKLVQRSDTVLTENVVLSDYMLEKKYIKPTEYFQILNKMKVPPSNFARDTLICKSPSGSRFVVRHVCEQSNGVA